jgi:unsaturated rhamnogalacturonyl hydrolase
MAPRFAAASFRSTAHAIACFGVASVFLLQTQAQTKRPLTIRVANQAMERWPDGRLGPEGTPSVWGFELGIVLCGMDAVWRATREPAYFQYVHHTVDQLVQSDSTIDTYNPQAYSLNNILIGRELLMLYRTTHEEKYRLAAKTLRQQIAAQPRTPSGGVWHAKATPDLMLLDDQFMLAPFYAEYAAVFHEPQDLDDVVKQFTLLEQHSRNASTGLMYHGWDESGRMPWADKSTGTSPSLWARGMGWYLMALADTLPYVPKSDPHHAVLLAMLQRACSAVLKAQDARTGLWYQILDQPGAKGNYIESSSVLMFTYAFAKSARLGNLSPAYGIAARRAWKAIQVRFVRTSGPEQVEITGTVTHVALGATPADDGSSDYYLHAPVVSNDAKGIGAFLLAGSEMELRGSAK